jgi:hypothetical protein
MAALQDVVEAIKSANAGASWLTFDIVFPDVDVLGAVWATQVLGPPLFADLYHVDEEAVRVYRCDAVNTIKVTIPRQSGMGGPDETDFDGVQQFAPLLPVDIPLDMPLILAPNDSGGRPSRPE